MGPSIMADDGKTYAQIDKELFEKFQKKYHEEMERNKRLERQQIYCGSKYPPMAIEPFPYERQRLAGAGMSDADRALRKQWVLDQRLAPNEPRFVPELESTNIFRR